MNDKREGVKNGNWRIQSHYQDWMIDVSIDIYSDTSAAGSVAGRRGIGGRLGHMQTVGQLKPGCCCWRTKNIRHAHHQAAARLQDSRVV